MIMLKSVFKKNGYTFKLIKRNEHFAITEQYSSAFPDHIIAYEVFRIKINYPTKRVKLSEPKESTPSNNQWGNYAKSVTSLPKALEYFNTWTKELETNELVKQPI